MEFTRKNAVVAAGLSAVLALTPVAAPASVAFAGNGGDSAVQAQSGQTSNVVTVYTNGANCANWTMPDQAADVLNIAEANAPDGQKFAGTWTVTWTDGTTIPGKTIEELAGDWGNVTIITAEYTEEEEENPAVNWLDIDVFDVDGNKVGAVTIPEGEAFLGGYSGSIAVPEGYEIDYFDVQGSPIGDGAWAQAWWEGTGLAVHFKQVEASDPASEFVTVHLLDSDGTFIRDVTVQRGTSNWSGVLTNPVKDGYTFVG